MSSKRPAVLGLAGLLWSSATALAQSAPPLGASASFAVLGGSAVRNSGPSLVTGNLGVSPGTVITGSPTVRLGDVRNDLAAGAQSDAAVAYGLLGAGTCSSTQGATTLPPGVYCLSTLDRTLTLDAWGNDNAVWIFRGDSLTTTASPGIRLINGAHESNVFWRVAGTATLGPNTAFAGTLLAEGDVILGSGTSVSGRVIALGRASAVSLDHSSVSLCCPQISVINPGVATATVNAPFNQSFGQVGADRPFFTLTSGRLPWGLAPLTQGGTLSGTPTERGTFPIEVRVTDGAGCTGTSAVYTLKVDCQTIAVTNPTNTQGVVGVQFSETFGQSGAVGRATFTTTSDLHGLTLQGDGTLVGTPMETGCFPIVVKVTDSNGCTGDGATYLLCIGCQPIIVIDPTNDKGTAGVPFKETFSQNGAIGTPTFTTSDPLPAGFTLSPMGVLSGTTTQPGCHTITVKVTDSNGCIGAATYKFCIECQTIIVTNPGVTSGTEGDAFCQTFTAIVVLGTPAFTTADTLPAGLTLGMSTGVLSGTPTENGVFIIHVTATDTNGCSGTGPPYTLTINPPLPPQPVCPGLVISPPGLAPAIVAVPYLQALTVTGGTPPYTFSVTDGMLPSGLSLVPTGPASASITGIPTINAEMNVTITATDVNGCTGFIARTSIPTLSGWALTALAAVLAALGLIALRNGGI